jgi:hypothetical protein
VRRENRAEYSGEISPSISGTPRAPATIRQLPDEDAIPPGEVVCTGHAHAIRRRSIRSRRLGGRVALASIAGY